MEGKLFSAMRRSSLPKYVATRKIELIFRTNKMNENEDNSQCTQAQKNSREVVTNMPVVGPKTMPELDDFSSSIIVNELEKCMRKHRSLKEKWYMDKICYTILLGISAYDTFSGPSNILISIIVTILTIVVTVTVGTLIVELSMLLYGVNAQISMLKNNIPSNANTTLITMKPKTRTCHLISQTEKMDIAFILRNICFYNGLLLVCICNIYMRRSIYKTRNIADIIAMIAESLLLTLLNLSLLYCITKTKQWKGTHK